MLIVLIVVTINIIIIPISLPYKRSVRDIVEFQAPLYIISFYSVLTEAINTN